MNIVTKKFCEEVVNKLNQWLEDKEVTHYLYGHIFKERDRYNCQLQLMQELQMDKVENQVSTNYFKQL